MKFEFNWSLKFFLILTVIILIWLGGVNYGQQKTLQLFSNDEFMTQPVSSTSQPTVSLMLDNQQSNLQTFDQLRISAGDTVWDLLQKLEESEQINLQGEVDQQGQLQNVGLLGLSNDGFGQEWRVWVNNQYMSQPFNQIELSNQDVITIQFANYNPNGQ